MKCKAVDSNLNLRILPNSASLGIRLSVAPFLLAPRLSAAPLDLPNACTCYWYGAVSVDPQTLALSLGLVSRTGGGGLVVEEGTGVSNVSLARSLDFNFIPCPARSVLSRTRSCDSVSRTRLRASLPFSLSLSLPLLSHPLCASVNLPLQCDIAGDENGSVLTCSGTAVIALSYSLLVLPRLSRTRRQSDRGSTKAYG